ncbi:MAG TPA: hypothetical protein PKA28_10840 [Methylomusa anaerophila]|nr:hypothetical protein [Methylomusa anaerophila]HML88931.1 hypothetical protein [Methylomusa anaerophila]
MDTGQALRRACLSLAQATFTSVEFWLGLTIDELTAWMEDAKSLAQKR